MLANLTGWHAIILLAVILLLFGATRLPALARSVGQSARIFRAEVKPADQPAHAASVDAPSPAVAGHEPVHSAVTEPARAFDDSHDRR
jgi:sec-independent protein translocase protein TatA